MKENAYHFHLPLFLISNGLERILKCIILINYNSIEGRYPNDKSFFKKTNTSLITGHELVALFDAVATIYKNSNKMIHMKDLDSDFRFISTHYLPKKVLLSLNEFSTETRYRSLNVMLGINDKKYISPEDSIIDLIEKIKNKEYSHLDSNEYRLFDLAVREIFVTMVKMVRFLSGFFVFGGYHFEGIRHIDQAWPFLKYSGDPKLDIDKYKKPIQ
jgi:hypothetical protein